MVALLAASLFFPGCLGKAPAANNVTNVTPSTPSAPAPSFMITEPAQGDSITTTDDTANVSVTLSPSNLRVEPSGMPNAAGEGHFEISIDGGDYSSLYEKSYTVPEVPVGTYTVEVQLVNNDGTPYSPPVTQSVTFAVVQSQSSVYTPETYSVSIGNFSYSPASLTVNVGDSINWTNTGAYPRSATSTGNFDTKVLAPGASVVTVMYEEGTFDYFSLTDVAMKGTIIVESNSSD